MLEGSKAIVLARAKLIRKQSPLEKGIRNEMGLISGLACAPGLSELGFCVSVNNGVGFLLHEH